MTISVVMPVYNAEETLPLALDSLRAQTDPNWELFAVDDGSEDDSSALLEAYGRLDRRIHLIRSRHAGIVSALGWGIQACKGPLVARMDADDVSHPERFARQSQFLDQNPSIGLVSCRVHYEGDSERHAGFAHYVAWTNALLSPEDIYRQRFVESPLVHPTVMFRRELIERFGGYREGAFPEDYELWLRFLEEGVRMAKLEETLFQWREQPGRLSRTDPRYARVAFDRLKSAFLGRWLGKKAITSLIVWGAGRISRQRIAFLAEQEIRIEAFVDIDPRKIGQHIRGIPVIAPDALPAGGQTLVLSCVGSRGARQKIAAFLEEKGYREGCGFLSIA